MKEKMEGVVGALAFSPTPENELEFDEKTYVAQKVMTSEEFGRAFLEEKMEKNSRNQGMDR